MHLSSFVLKYAGRWRLTVRKIILHQFSSLKLTAPTVPDASQSWHHTVPHRPQPCIDTAGHTARDRLIHGPLDQWAAAVFGSSTACCGGGGVNRISRTNGDVGGLAGASRARRTGASASPQLNCLRSARARRF